MNISLTQGQVAIIDDVDAELAQFNWCATFEPKYANGGAYRAVRNLSHAGGVKRASQRLHRAVMERMLERKLGSKELVDHINHDPLDNRRCNLRLSSSSQNQQNQRRRKDNTSGYKGVSFAKREGMWRARIHHQTKEITIGYFPNAIEAAKAYDAKAKELHGEFAVLNFPDRD